MCHFVVRANLKTDYSHISVYSLIKKPYIYRTWIKLNVANWNNLHFTIWWYSKNSCTFIEHDPSSLLKFVHSSLIPSGTFICLSEDWLKWIFLKNHVYIHLKIIHKITQYKCTTCVYFNSLYVRKYSFYISQHWDMLLINL